MDSEGLWKYTQPMPRESHFSPELFAFLRQLKRHNNRDWFQIHKTRYEQSVRDPFLNFIRDFQPQLQKISPHFIVDPRPSGGSLLRIYKDLRFRPDAPPYKTMAAARFPHSAFKRTVAPGFYLHLEPGKCFLGGGLWHPDPQTRSRIRDAIVGNPSQWKKATSSKAFKTNCTLGGDLLKRLPPALEDHPFAHDLKRKDFIMYTSFPDTQVCAPDFLSRVSTICRASGPFMEFLTRALDLPWASGDKVPLREVASVESLQLG
ncbi:MAG TPA: TIGR02453 family protein [Pyrinomonadaceae bacterium]|nr:TIGR02453 family protein [Pyrinomonadaceae bacterium]